jgi:hypothetical protein
MNPQIACNHEDASWPLEGEILCTGCLLRMLIAMDAEDALYGELATEVLQ